MDSFTGVRMPCLMDVNIVLIRQKYILYTMIMSIGRDSTSSFLRNYHSKETHVRTWHVLKV
jgi:hypothetical protein